METRVQALRCTGCHRLRPHPKMEDSRTWNCGCGDLRFVSTFPHPDEEQLALKLYAREIEEANLYTAVAQEAVREHERGRLK